MEIMEIKREVNHHHLLNLQAKFTYDPVNKTAKFTYDCVNKTYQDNHGSDHGIRKTSSSKTE